MILIVEDEFLVNWTITNELESHGCEVISAFNADEANSNPSKPHRYRSCLHGHPGSMDGLKLAVAIRNRWPPIQVIVTSGKAIPSALPEQVSFLGKPYMSEIVRRVEQYCD